MPRVEYFLIHAGPVFSPAAFYLFDECTGTLLFRLFLRYLIRRAAPVSKLRWHWPACLVSVEISKRIFGGCVSFSDRRPRSTTSGYDDHDGPLAWLGSDHTIHELELEVSVTCWWAGSACLFPNGPKIGTPGSGFCRFVVLLSIVKKSTHCIAAHTDFEIPRWLAPIVVASVGLLVSRRCFERLGSCWDT